MSLKRVEFESLGKSFLLFFLSLTLLMSMILYSSYTKEVQSLDEDLFTQMRICSFDFKCDKFEFDFVSADQDKLYQIHKNDVGVYALFSMPSTSEFIIKLLYPQTHYQNELDSIKEEHIYKYLLILMVLALVSILFSWYALKPLRQALILSDEFIKDILHDFNTPLSSIRLNGSLLKKELPENKKVQRLEQAVETVLNLQDNLRSYIDESPLQNETIDIKELIEARCAFFAASYPKISFAHHLDRVKVDANRDAITRILDNLISNAAKYNKRNGSVDIFLSADDHKLVIKDTGKGIQHPQKIFERFYKEHDRGLGIGLHIVKKLCDSLHISIDVHSQIDVGSSFTLDLRNIISA